MSDHSLGLLGRVLASVVRSLGQKAPASRERVNPHEGWAHTGLYRSFAHYFRDSQSLCRRYRSDNRDTGIIRSFQPDRGPEPGQCKECRRRLDRSTA